MMLLLNPQMPQICVLDGKSFSVDESVQSKILRLCDRNPHTKPHFNSSKRLISKTMFIYVILKHCVESV